MGECHKLGIQIIFLTTWLVTCVDYDMGTPYSLFQVAKDKLAQPTYKTLYVT